MSLREIIISIQDWFSYLLRKWYILLLAIIIGILFGYIYFSSTPANFLASSSFVVEETGKSADNGLASMFGQASSTGLFQGDNLQWLYTTQLMIQKTLMSPVSEGNKQLIIDRFLGMDNDILKMRTAPDFASVKFEPFQASFSKPQTQVLDACIGLIKANYLKVNSIEKTQGVIKVDLISHDELFSKAFVETLVKTVNDYYVTTKTSNKVHQIEELERKAAQYNANLNQGIMQSAQETDNVPYPNPDLTTAQVKPQRTNVDVELTSEMYGQTMNTLETSKLELARTTPLITVIDSPKLPLPVVKMSLKACIAIGVGAFLFLTLLILIAVRAYKLIMAMPALPYNATVATA